MTTYAIPVGGISIETVGATLIPAIGGATISSGAGVYRDNTDSLELKAVDVTGVLSASAIGFLFGNTTDGAGAVVVPSGIEISGWTGLTKWDIMYFDTGGGLTNDPATDMAGGEYVTMAGIVVTTTSILTRIVPTGLTV